jgi:hypothetical protein
MMEQENLQHTHMAESTKALPFLFQPVINKFQRSQSYLVVGVTNKKRGLNNQAASFYKKWF